ncbi:MAG: endonuclease [Deltaproteobacteria bacterium]|nr:endonuclease [Deltaproteobacteria bacterium]
MSCQNAVYQWTEVVTKPLPHLSKPQATVLALWSVGLVLARSCALTAVSLFLAEGLERKANTVRQQLREWCYEAKAKRGQPRQELAVESCFAPLLGWVLSWWEGNQVALAIDATTLGQRFVVLVVSVVYRGCAIPVAWTVLPATEKHAWRGEWLRMLRQVRAVVPSRFFVLVLADRGLYARWLFQRIVRLGGHPLLRINTGGTFRPAKSARSRPLRELVPQPGTQWVGTGTAFQGPRRRLNCTLLARWDDGYKDPWLLLTDLAPSAGEACWYGLRAWIEQGFKITKRGGWQWQRTRMTDPQRAARLWLAVAVATLWLLSVGGLAEDTIPESTLLPLADDDSPASRSRRATRLRLVSIFRRGWIVILRALINQRRLPQGRFKPEPWPQPSLTHKGVPEMPLAA